MSTSAYPPLPDGNEESEAAAAAAAVRPGSSRSVKAEQHTGGFGSPDGGAGDGTRALRAVSPLTAAAQAAHQGLAALQAATAARMQQQAQQAEQHPLIAIAPGPGGHAATAAAGEMPVDAVNVGVPGGNRYAAPAPSALAAPAPQKHRRLRRACDMCSSRKIRVRIATIVI